MDNYFNKINEYLFSLLTSEEILKVGMWGETSQFIRLNNSKISQELRSTILTKAAELEKESKNKKKK